MTSTIQHEASEPASWIPRFPDVCVRSSLSIPRTERQPRPKYVNPHDDPENCSPGVSFGDCREGAVLLTRRGTPRSTGAQTIIDFYLIVSVNRETRRLRVRSVDGDEFDAWCWSFDSVTTQYTAEAAGARWRIPPQERPGLVGPPMHPYLKTGDDDDQ